MRKYVPPWLPIVLATTLLTLALASPAVASSPTYTFNLIGPQVTTNGTQTITMTGTGSFDPSAETVIASGNFLITNNSNGAVVEAGMWKATSFVSFCPRGGPNSGSQGGVLVITVTLFPIRGEPVTGVSLTVTCRVTNQPNNACGAGAEGVTVTGSAGTFTDVQRGASLFHLNQ